MPYTRTTHIIHTVDLIRICDITRSILFIFFFFFSALDDRLFFFCLPVTSLSFFLFQIHTEIDEMNKKKEKNTLKVYLSRDSRVYCEVVNENESNRQQCQIPDVNSKRQSNAISSIKQITVNFFSSFFFVLSFFVVFFFFLFRSNNLAWNRYLTRTMLMVRLRWLAFVVINSE